MGEKKLSWDPVRVGRIYCAPACGRGCLWEDYEVRFIYARDLAARLGPGWKPRVWENLGWHGSVVGAGGHLHLSFGWSSLYEKAMGFNAFLNDSDTGGAGRWHAAGKTPASALRAVFKKFDEEMRSLANLEREIFRIRRSGPVMMKERK